jgi:uncharacterized Zn finger protein (UPF0148 family)
MTADDLQHLAGSHRPFCTGKDCKPQQDGTPRLSQPGRMLCRRCGERLEQNLAEAPARHDQLAAELAHVGGGGGMRRGTPELPVPLNVRAYVALGHLDAIVASWAALVREERHLHGPDSDNVGPLSAWMLSQLDWIVQQPWVDDMDEELREASRDADVITGMRPLRNRLEAACPRCGARELGRDDGADRVDCASCGSAWEESYYPALVRLALDDSRGCVTATEAAERLEMSVGAFRNIVHRGRVRKLGTVDGQARYSAADVEALLGEDEEESA